MNLGKLRAERGKSSAEVRRSEDSAKSAAATTMIEGPVGVSCQSDRPSPPRPDSAPTAIASGRHRLGRARQAAGGGGGDDQHGGDQQRADDLQRDGDDQGEGDDEDQPFTVGLDAGGVGQILADGGGQKRLPAPGEQARTASAPSQTRASSPAR